MTIKTCDKCGDKINTNPLQNMVLPMFRVNKMVDMCQGWQSVDLCPKCEKELAEWLDYNTCKQSLQVASSSNSRSS